jgi:hypothetical protein
MVRMFAVLFAFATAAPYEPVGAVHTGGCLALEGDKWVLTHATDPVVTEISPLTPDEEAAADAIEKLGENRFHLIGIEAFDLPKHEGHKVQVKGLFIEASPESRVNITSVRHMASECPGA